FPALAPAAGRWRGRPLDAHRPLHIGGHLPAADARHARGNVVSSILDALKKVEAIERRPLELPPSPSRPPTSRRIGVAVAIVLAAALGLALWFRPAPHEPAVPPNPTPPEAIAKAPLAHAPLADHAPHAHARPPQSST